MTQRRKVMAMAATIGSLLLGACSIFGVRSGTEEPPFTIVDRLGTTEIRRYEARIAAETTVSGDPAAARSEGFTRLAGYIFGGNARRDRIERTAPGAHVAGARGEAIAMTAPVAQAASSEGSVIRFFLPAKLSDPPFPTDGRVHIVRLPAEMLAVRRYSGPISGRAVADETQGLLSSLADTGWAVAGTPVAWFYDPPWTLPPLRRNEVAVPVTAAPAAPPEFRMGLQAPK